MQHRLGASIAALLSVVSLDRVAPEVPDEGRRREAELEARVEHSPAYVNVVARGRELRIESANLCERRLREEHVAACQVLRSIVGDQDVARRARRCGATGFDPAVFVRRVVRSAASVEIAFDHRADHQRQPMRIDDAVRIGVRDYFAARRLHPDVARDAQSLVGLANETELRKVHRDVSGAIA